MQSSVIIGNEFINLFTEDNPIMNAGDSCYFLLFNSVDFHLPIVCRGEIVQDTFVDGFNKQYMIKIIEFIDSPKIINKYVIGNTFVSYPVLKNSGKIQSRKSITISTSLDFERWVFKVESFFVRPTLEQIVQLRKEFGNHILSDLQRMTSELNELLV